MRKLTRMAGGMVPASLYNTLVDAIEELQRSTVGPGLGMQQSGAGRSIVLNAKGESPCGNSEDERNALDFTLGTQDTDTWNIDEDGADDEKGCEVQVVTDVSYSITTRLFTVRTRTLSFDKCGRLVAISAEGATSTWATAYVCD